MKRFLLILLFTFGGFHFLLFAGSLLFDANSLSGIQWYEFIFAVPITIFELFKDILDENYLEAISVGVPLIFSWIGGIKVLVERKDAPLAFIYSLLYSVIALLIMVVIFAIIGTLKVISNEPMGILLAIVLIGFLAKPAYYVVGFIVE